MLRPPRSPVAVSLTLAVCAAWTAVQAAVHGQAPPFAITTDHANAIYTQGEAVAFTVQLVGDSPLARDAELAWSISKDGLPPIQTGKTQLVNGTASVTGKLDEPGHLLCRMTATASGKAVEALAGAAIDPLLIKPSLPVQDNFDVFGGDQKKQLAAVPMNPRLTPVATTVATHVH